MIHHPHDDPHDHPHHEPEPPRRARGGTRRGTRRFALLPNDKYVGWTPYAWLIYLPTFVLEPLAEHRPGGAIALTVLGTVVFLASYFRGYWVNGWQLGAVIALETALGVAFAPINGGSSVFFIYAGAFAGRLERPRDALRAIGAVSAAALATSYAFHMPPFFWGVATLFPWIIGGANLHFAQVGRAQRRLRLAQDEIAHLAAVAERERIARDLHDVLGHTLSLITLKAELAAKLVDRDAPRATREMREVERVSREALQQVREAIRGYRASLADELSRARALLSAATITATIDVPPNLALPRAVDEALAFAVREAVTNVVRHSGARSCGIRLRVDGGALRLDVFDDGRGAPAADGTGLHGMRERIESLGGTLARRHDRGTTISVVLPGAPRETDMPVERLTVGA